MVPNYIYIPKFFCVCHIFVICFFFLQIFGRYRNKLRRHFVSCSCCFLFVRRFVQGFVCGHCVGCFRPHMHLLSCFPFTDSFTLALVGCSVMMSTLECLLGQCDHCAKRKPAQMISVSVRSGSSVGTALATSSTRTSTLWTRMWRRTAT